MQLEYNDNYSNNIKSELLSNSSNDDGINNISTINNNCLNDELWLISGSSNSTTVKNLKGLLHPFFVFQNFYIFTF